MQSPLVSEAPSQPALADAPDLLDSTEAGGRIVRGGVLRLLGYGSMVGLSVLSTALLTRHLGVSSFGDYTTVISLVTVVSYVTDAGMSAVGVREFAVRSGAERDALMSDLLGLRVMLTLVGVLIVAGFVIADGYSSALLAGAVLASLGTVALVVQHTHTISITAELRIGTLAALELTRQALSVAMIVALVALGAGVLPLLAVQLAANAMLIAPTAALARRQVSLRMAFRPRRWLALLRLTVVFSLASAVSVLYNYTTQIITSLVASEHQSGLFAAPFRIFVVVAITPMLLVTGALPLLARAARDDHERLGYALSRIFEVSLILGVAATLATLGGAQFMIAVIAGPKYAASAPVLQLQGVALIASFVLAGWSFALLSLERYKQVLVANLLAFLVSCSLTSILASSHGALGAALASVCAESALALGLLVALARERPDLRPRLGFVLKVALAGAPAAVLALRWGASSPVRMLLALGLYGVLIVLTRAVPGEVVELLPGRARRGR
jgi:O-antigen/teichoic acid export membrane protein